MLGPQRKHVRIVCVDRHVVDELHVPVAVPRRQRLNRSDLQKASADHLGRALCDGTLPMFRLGWPKVELTGVIDQLACQDDVCQNGRPRLSTTTPSRIRMDSHDSNMQCPSHRACQSHAV